MRREQEMKDRRRISRSKIWTGSIAAAFLAAVGVFAVMLQLERNLLEAYEKDWIYVVEKELPKGMELTEENIEDFLCLAEVDVKWIPETALRVPEELMGLVAKEKIEKGVPVTAGMFERPDHITEGMSQPVIAGFKAEDLYQVVGGVLRAGDRIHIYTVGEDGGARLIWSSVYVKQVFDGSGNKIKAGDSTSPAQRMNIFLDAKDVEEFYSELARGSLRVVKVCDV